MLLLLLLQFLKRAESFVEQSDTGLFHVLDPCSRSVRCGRACYFAAQNGSSRRSYVLLLIFFFSFFLHEIYELCLPISANLCHVIGSVLF